LTHVTVWLLRHGQRLDFVQPQWFLTAPYPYDPPLSAYGIYQALELVQQLGGQQIQQIFTSPHLRALQTAQPVAQNLGLRPQVEFGLREWLHPQWSQGLPTLAPPQEHLPPIPTNPDYQSLLQPQYPETAEELTARADRMVEKLIIAAVTDVLIVAHKHILLSMVSILNGAALPAVEMVPATLISLSSTERTRGSWKLRPLLPGPSAAPDRPA
jgi:broad specificity phosphatase PhoE